MKAKTTTRLLLFNGLNIIYLKMGSKIRRKLKERNEKKITLSTLCNQV